MGIFVFKFVRIAVLSTKIQKVLLNCKNILGKMLLFK